MPKRLKLPCIYCAEALSTDWEHVVAGQFFSPKPPDDKLILAPSCHPCNESFSKDEEYVRLKLVWEFRVSNHPSAQELLGHQGADGKVARSIRSSTGIQKMMRRDFSRRNLITYNGLVIPNRLTLDIDPHRVHRVLQKICRGLFYHETKRIFPITGKVRIIYLDDSAVLDISLQPIVEVARALLVETRADGPRRLGRGEFSYTFRFVRGQDQSNSIWLISFYDGVYFAVHMEVEFQKLEHPQQTEC